MRGAVWVTGVGVTSAAGIGREAMAALLRDERSALTASPALDSRPVGRAPASSGVRRLDRSAALLVASAEEAWLDAGLDQQAPVAARCALIEGSSLGPLADTLSSHAERVAAGFPVPRPSAILKYMGGTGGAEVARLHGIRGPVLHINAGSTSGATAIGEAYEMVASGRVDIAIAGGTECPLHPEIIAHFAASGLLAAPDGAHAGCRPFDRWRSGTVLGEGAGMVVLESAAHARRRGARPRAIVQGFGMSCEAHSATSPDPTGRGVTAAVAQAIERVARGNIRWIKSHGTGTAANDVAECRGLEAAFGARLAELPMTSLKASLGHSLGASGATETVAAILAMNENFVPATLATEEIDPALPRCRVVRTREHAHAGVALVLAEGFGGRCAALALEAA